MAYDYEKLYHDTPDALGAPTKAFVDFFNQTTGRHLRVLDIGCGQGRDALFIARLGHSVLGVDLAPSGIRDMVGAAKAEGLDVTGIVQDITEFRPSHEFDVILIDRTLHMLPETPRLSCLQKLLDHAAPGGWCLIADERRNLAGFRTVFAAHHYEWTAEVDKGGTLFMQRGN